MDFALTEEQERFKKEMREFALRELEPVAAQIDVTAEFPWENTRKMVAMGLTGMMTPPEYGGNGRDSITYAIAVEEIARVCASTANVLATDIGLGCHCILHNGTEEQRKRYVVPIAKGEKIGAFALTEPNAGSDASSIETTAVRQGDEYVLNGQKIFITLGDVADTVCVFATLDKSLGTRGITGFIVEKGTPGFSVGKLTNKMGMRAAHNSELWFHDCRIPVTNRLGEEGRGMRVALSTVDAGRIGVAAQSLGIAQGALDASIKWAKQRQQFGGPIANLQAIQWMIADTGVAVHAARLMTYCAAYLKDKGLPFTKEGAMAKLFASETAMTASWRGVQIHGGYGYMKEYPVERFFRDAKLTEIYEGTSEVQRLVISRNLLAES